MVAFLLAKYARLKTAVAALTRHALDIPHLSFLSILAIFAQKKSISS